MKFYLLLFFLYFLAGCGTVSTAAQPQQEVRSSATATATPTRSAPTLVAIVLPESQTQPPIRLQIPTLRLDVTVVAMDWQVEDVGGVRQAVWQVPLDAAGWHPNSGKPGSIGTMLISGHHRLGQAVFAPIAQGGVQQGIEIIVKDALERQWHYQVVEVSQPIPVEGATDAERAQFDSYLASGERSRLVLLTGWPEFSDTHYVAVIAELDH